MEQYGAARVQEFGRILKGEQVQYRDPNRPFLIYHADGMFPKWSALEEGDKPHEGAGIWEFKAPGSDMAAKMAREGMTPSYVCQGQMGMHVAGAALDLPIMWGTYGYWDYDEWDLVAFDVALNAEFHAKALPAIDAFWKCVVNDTPPPPLEETEVILPPEIKGELEVFTEGPLPALASSLRNLRLKVLDEALLKEKLIKGEMKLLLEDYSKAEVPGVMKFGYTQGKDRVSYDGPGLVAFCEHLMAVIDSLSEHGVAELTTFDPSYFITTKPGSRSFRPTVIKE